MPITKQQKQQIVGDLTEKFKRSKALAFAYFSGLTVRETEELRQRCHREQVDYKVIRKTLMALSFDQAGIVGVGKKSFDRAVAVAIGYDDEVTPARILAQFAKDHEALRIAGGVLAGSYVDAAMVSRLAALPTRDQLRAQLLGSLNAPMSGLVNVMQGSIRSLVYALSAVRDAKV